MRYVDGLQVLCQNHHTSLSCNFFLFMTGKSKKKKVRWEEANVLKPPTNIGICCNVQCHPKLPQIYANMNPMAHQVSKKDSERRPRQKLEHPKLKKMKKEKKKKIIHEHTNLCKACSPSFESKILLHLLKDCSLCICHCLLCLLLLDLPCWPPFIPLTHYP